VAANAAARSNCELSKRDGANLNLRSATLSRKRIPREAE
jgi:hypothetical protein